MKGILSYKDFHTQEVFESNITEDIEQTPEENAKITEITPDGIVTVNNDGETSIITKEEIEQ